MDWIGCGFFSRLYHTTYTQVTYISLTERLPRFYLHRVLTYHLHTYYLHTVRWNMDKLHSIAAMTVPHHAIFHPVKFS